MSLKMYLFVYDNIVAARCFQKQLRSSRPPKPSSLLSRGEFWPRWEFTCGRYGEPEDVASCSFHDFDACSF